MDTPKKTRWKWLLILWLPIIAIVTSLFTENDVVASKSNSPIIVRDTITIVETVIKDDLPVYLYALRSLEANLNYKARRINTDKNGKKSGSQYIGAYQMGNSAREQIGLAHLNNEGGYKIILNDSTLQDIIMMQYLKDQVIEMQPYFKKYNNTKVGKWFITNSGILAMSHLLGTENTKAFLDSKGQKISKDGNGRPITDYLQLNNFDIFVDSIPNEKYLQRVLSFSNFSRPF